MAVTSIALTNPGAEAADTSGWTVAPADINFGGQGTFSSVTDANGGVVLPHAGSRFFKQDASVNLDNQTYQDVAVPGGITAAVDAGTIAIKWAGWCQKIDNGWGRLRLEMYDGSGNLLWSQPLNSPYSQPTTWTQLVEYYGVLPNTRTFRVIFDSLATSLSSPEVYWDDFTLDYSDAPATDWPSEGFSNQLGLYAVANAPADEALVNQLGIQLVANAETDNGFHDIIAHQLGLYALARRGGDRKELRAWTFKQDDHEFYVLQLNGEDTIVFDKLTGQWTDWVSPDFDHWRGADGCNWAGIAVCGDTASGKLWKIDPDGRLDYETTPITSIIVGGMTERMRLHVPVYMAELAVSEEEPALTEDEDTEGVIGITLRTGDGKGNWYEHGDGVGIDENVTVRWYGLGLARSPGMVFEFTNTGYARRVDGLNIEVPDSNDG